MEEGNAITVPAADTTTVKQQKGQQKYSCVVVTVAVSCTVAVATIIALLLRLRASNWSYVFFRRVPWSETQKRVCSKIVHNELYSLVGAVQKILECHSIPFWPVDGTLLGCVRHSAAVPWDDDADLGIWSTDSAKAQAILQQEAPAFFKITVLMGVVQIVKATDGHGCCVDLIPWKREKGTNLIVPAIRLANLNHLGFWTQAELEPSPTKKTFTFGTITLPRMRGACAYLDRFYPKWREIVWLKQHNVSLSRAITDTLFRPWAKIPDSVRLSLSC